MPQKHEVCGVFTVFGKFSWKNLLKNIGNEEWIEFETATITSDYVVHNHLSIS